MSIPFVGEQQQLGDGNTSQGERLRKPPPVTRCIVYTYHEEDILHRERKFAQQHFT